MSELILGPDAWVVPSCTGKPHCLDMRRIYKAERRLAELSGVTKMKAGELIHCFVEAYGEARRFRAVLKAEFDMSKHRLRKLRGLIVLDKAPEELKRRQLATARSPAGSEDLRDSVVYTDPDYEAAVNHLAQVEAAHDEMDSKVEKLKMGYFSVGELIKGAEMPLKISGGVGDDPAELSPAERARDFAQAHSSIASVSYGSGFGTPKL